MLHSRLRPLPRKHHPSHSQSHHDLSTEGSPPAPDFHNISNENEDDDYDPEDIFASFLPHLLPDDAPSFHGDPGQRLLYESPLYGSLQIMVPSYPAQSEKRTEEIAAGLRDGEDYGESNEVEEGRRLFAHFLWSAAMVVAEVVEDAAAAEAGKWNAKIEKRMKWSVKGRTVLELGAG
jgi:hypothetical protein